MKYYEVNLVRERGTKKEDFFIDIFDFPDKESIIKYLCESYPAGLEFHVKELDEEEAKKTREKRKRELEENVTMTMSQIHWNVDEQTSNNTKKSYAIMTREKILGVMEFSSDKEVQKYINLYPIPIACFETKNEEHARIIRRQIRRELRKPIEELIHNLWGNLGEPLDSQSSQ
jgi:hypothetical protein